MTDKKEQWRRRTRGTSNQVGNAFVVAPSRSKLKQNLPRIDVVKMSKPSISKRIGKGVDDAIDTVTNVPSLESWLERKRISKDRAKHEQQQVIEDRAMDDLIRNKTIPESEKPEVARKIHAKLFPQPKPDKPVEESNQHEGIADRMRHMKNPLAKKD